MSSFHKIHSNLQVISHNKQKKKWNLQMPNKGASALNVLWEQGKTQTTGRIIIQVFPHIITCMHTNPLILESVLQNQKCNIQN